MYYAVHKGNHIGIFTEWEHCKKSIHGYKNAIFKKFKTKKQADFFVKYGMILEMVAKKPDHKIKKTIAKQQQINRFFQSSNDKIINLKSQETQIRIFTDGSLIRKKNQILCGYGIYIPSKNIKLAKPLKENKTNNRAEMMAILDCLKMFHDDLSYDLHIFTDSKYCMLIFDKTGLKYKSNNFKSKDGKDVPNKDLIIKALEYKHFYKNRLQFFKVKAHTTRTDRISEGNRIADKLAIEGAHKSI